MSALGLLALTLTIAQVQILKHLRVDSLAALSSGLSLPTSTTTIQLQEAETLAVSRHGIYVAGDRVLETPGAELSSGELEVLERRLLERRAHHQRLESLGGPAFHGDLLIAADRQLRYGLVYQVLEAAAHAGFPQLRLVTTLP